MSYLKTIEFLVKEVAKANEQIESLTRKAEDDKSVIDRLSKLHDKYFSEAKSAKDDLDIWKGELDSCSNQLKFAKKDVFELEADLVEMTTEKDHWKEEALEYRDKERSWWAKEKEYKDRIKGLIDDFDRLNDDVVRLKKDCIELETDYVCEANSVGELEHQLSELREYIDKLTEENNDLKSKVIDANQYRIKVVGELEDELTLTKKRYQDLIKQNKEVDAINSDIIKDLQLEINHLKNNK